MVTLYLLYDLYDCFEHFCTHKPEPKLFMILVDKDTNDISVFNVRSMEIMSILFFIFSRYVFFFLLFYSFFFLCFYKWCVFGNKEILISRAYFNLMLQILITGFDYLGMD